MNAEALPTGRRGQALAVLLALAVVCLIWFGAVAPVRAWFEDQALLLQRRQALLARMRQVAETLPELKDAAAKQPGADSTGTLPGASDAVAAADLQERVQRMAASSGASLMAVETLPASDVVSGQGSPARWHKISLRISINAPWPVLMELLDAIHRSPARILIDDVHFHVVTVSSHPAVLPVQASMVLYGIRSTGSSL